MVNIQTNIAKIEKRYWASYERMNLILNGGGGPGIQSNADHWAELYRKDAVTMGNRLFKLTGVYPDKFDEVKRWN